MGGWVGGWVGGLVGWHAGGVAGRQLLLQPLPHSGTLLSPRSSVALLLWCLHCGPLLPLQPAGATLASPWGPARCTAVRMKWLGRRRARMTTAMQVRVTDSKRSTTGTAVLLRMCCTAILWGQESHCVRFAGCPPGCRVCEQRGRAGTGGARGNAGSGRGGCHGGCCC